MSTVTMELPDEVALLVTTPEGMARAQALLVQMFSTLSDETHLTADDEKALDEAYEAVRQGRVHPFDPKRAQARVQELLQQ